MSVTTQEVSSFPVKPKPKLPTCPFHNNPSLVFFFGVIPPSLNFPNRRFGTLCSILVGLVNNNNNWDETATVSMQAQVWPTSSLGQSEGGGTDRDRACPSRGTGCGERWPHGKTNMYGRNGQASCGPSLYLYQYPSNVVPFTALVHTTYEDGTRFFMFQFPCILSLYYIKN